MRIFMIRTGVLAVSIGISAAAWASELAEDGKYIAHGPAATADFEAGLYKLSSLYARGVWPSQQVISAGVGKEDIPRDQLAQVHSYIEMVVANRYWPTSDASVRGVRHLYDKRTAILLWQKVDKKNDINMEITASTIEFTATFTSAKAFDRSPADVTKDVILKELGGLLAIPQELLAKGVVAVSTVDVGGTAVAIGTVRVPSRKYPEDGDDSEDAEATESSEDAGDTKWRGGSLDRFYWYNSITFWTVKGKIFVSVMPIIGAQSRPYTISLEESKDK